MPTFAETSAPTDPFGLGSLTLDLGGLFGPAPDGTSVPTETATSTSAQLDPAMTNAITGAVVGTINQVLGAIGIGPNSPQAIAERQRQAREAQMRTMLLVGGVAVAGIALVLILRR